MTNQIDLILVPAGALTPTAVAAYVFLSRERAYAAWAKVTSILASIAGLAWGAVEWALLHSQSLHLAPDVHNKLIGARGMLGGLVLGFMLSILIAQPYKKRNFSDPSDAAPT